MALLERVGDNRHKFEGGKAGTAVVMPPQAQRELQVKQNKTKEGVRNGPTMHYTDPAIHSSCVRGRYGRTDRGRQGSIRGRRLPQIRGTGKPTFWLNS